MEGVEAFSSDAGAWVAGSTTSSEGASSFAEGEALGCTSILPTIFGPVKSDFAFITSSFCVDLTATEALMASFSSSLS